MHKHKHKHKDQFFFSLKLCTSLNQSLQNNNMKSQIFVWSENQDPDNKLFEFKIWN